MEEEVLHLKTLRRVLHVYKNLTLLLLFYMIQISVLNSIKNSETYV